MGANLFLANFVRFGNDYEKLFRLRIVVNTTNPQHSLNPANNQWPSQYTKSALYHDEFKYFLVPVYFEIQYSLLHVVSGSVICKEKNVDYFFDNFFIIYNNSLLILFFENFC
jgi:hypothetical protein